MPPPNHHAPGVQNIRVFMCTAGTCGFAMCATRLTPEAQNRGSAPMPGTPRAAIAPRARSPRVPWTVETLTPTFSKARPPRITLISPPPPSSPRLVGVTSKRAGSPSPNVAASNASKAATMRSRSSRNHPAARSRRSSISVSVIARLLPRGA